MFQELKRKYLIKNLTGAIFAFIMGGIVLFTHYSNRHFIISLYAPYSAETGAFLTMANLSLFISILYLYLNLYQNPH